MSFPYCTLFAPAMAGFLLASVAALLNPTAAVGQIPCRYEVAHIIQGPHCGVFGYPPTTGGAISPNGRYVVGSYNACLSGSSRAFLFDTLTAQFTTLPLPPGFESQWAEDVNDNCVIVGGGDRTDIGQTGWVLEMPNSQYTIIEPLPGGFYSDVTGVNASGTICGWRSFGSGENPHNGFTWSKPEGFTDFGLINGVKN